MADWTAGDAAGLSVTINLSARELARPDLVQLVKDTTAHTRADPFRLVIEVTETAVMEDVEATAVTLRGLKNLGCRVWVDDFGTGYSSLSYSAGFHRRTQKVDASFVAGLGLAEEDSVGVPASSASAHARPDRGG